MSSVKKNSPNQLRRLAQEFQEHLVLEKGLSAGSIVHYKRYLKRFLDWAKLSKPAAINKETVRRYRLWLTAQRNQSGEPLKAITFNYHLIVLRRFLEYLELRDIASLAPAQIQLAKMSEREIEFLMADETERLLAAPIDVLRNAVRQRPTAPTRKTKTKAIRDRAIMEVLFSTGLRVSELIGLNRLDINLQQGEFSVRGKGGKRRVVFLSDSAKKALADYLTVRTDTDPALFIRLKSGVKKDDLRLTPRSVQRLIRYWATAAGIVKHVSPHTLRHSFATDLLMGGADLRSVQALLGHANVQTTQIYTHLTDPHLKDIHRRFHARKGKRQNKKS